ncbi:MAG: hypothetical protein JNJ40_03610 [Bacteroidia bacterium]|nr:hypothetical protein [Bacteroidia bacterium]
MFILILLFFFITNFKIENDPLHKRTFNISLSENKNGTPAKKNIADELYFKNGKLYSDFLNEKFNYNYIKYRINKDSIYIDDTDTEVRYLEVEAVETDDNNQTIYVNFITSEWNIDGVIRITKNDKVKRYYDLSGREKGGKPKKEKKQKKRMLQIVK